MHAAQDLLDAITAGDSATLTRLLDSGVDPATDDGEGTPVVLYAAFTGEIDVVRPFLDAGLPVDMGCAGDDNAGTTPLMEAVGVGSLPLVEFLLARGADVNLREGGDVEPATPLTRAVVLTEPLAIVSALLRAGADPNLARPDGWTPLMLAAHDGHVEVVRTLLAAGADVLASRANGEVTALGVAEYRQREEIAGLLREHGAADPVEACATRLAEVVSDIAGWLAEHAPSAYRDVTSSRGAADPAAVAELEAALGEHLPTDFKAYLRLFGGSGGLDVREYQGMSVEHILRTWRSSKALHDEGTFDDATPHGIEPGNQFVHCTWWHPGWVPFAVDGGGNQFCIDLAPAEHGVRGQVIEWEIRGGPHGPRALSFEQYLRDYRDKLLGGRYVWV